MVLDAIREWLDLANKSIKGIGVDLKFKKVRQSATKPTFSTPGSAGADLYAALEKPEWVGRTPIIIPVGIAVEIPHGYYGRIIGRSGNTLRGVIVYPGTIDCDYRGELSVIMHTTGWAYEVNPGDRIAQLLIHPMYRPVFHEVGELTETSRGESGLGSTGK